MPCAARYEVATAATVVGVRAPSAALAACNQNLGQLLHRQRREKIQRMQSAVAVLETQFLAKEQARPLSNPGREQQWMGTGMHATPLQRAHQ